MEPITGLLMLVSSIGMQFATNSANNKQSEELADLQRRYQDLLDRQKIEHSQQLQIEMNKLQVAMENEVHLLRMKEIENSHDEIIEGLVHGHDIDSWPLTVLPFVIKGKSLGTKIGGGAKTISIHCFLTPSNSARFNRILYSDLDIKLQSDINTNWSTRSSHPIFYYGGAWRDKSVDINHIFNCIDQLATELRSMPCVVITPYFEADGVSFRIKMWGMGDGETHSSSLVFKNANDNTKLEEIRFSYNYSVNQSFDKSDFADFGENASIELDNFLDTTIVEFSTYLQILIGYIADKYFWSMYGSSPILPDLLTSKAIDIEGLHWVGEGVKLLYVSTLDKAINGELQEKSGNVLAYYFGVCPMLSEINDNNYVDDILTSYCQKLTGISRQDLLSSLDDLVLDEQKSFISFVEFSKHDEIIENIEERRIKSYDFCDNVYLCRDILELCNKVSLCSQFYNQFFFQTINSHAAIGCFFNYLGVSKCCLIILTSEVKVTSQTYKIDLSSNRVVLFSNDAIKRIGVKINYKQIDLLCAKFLELYNDMISFGGIISKNYPFVINNARRQKSIDAKLLSWAKKIGEPSKEELLLMRFIWNDKYYLVAVVTNIGKVSFENYVSFQVDVIHPDIESIMNESSVKKICISNL